MISNIILGLLVFWCVTIIIWLSISLSPNSVLELNDLSKECITFGIRTDGFGGNLIQFFMLQALAKEQGIIACNSGHPIVDHVVKDGINNEKLRVRLLNLFNIPINGEKCNKCKKLEQNEVRGTKNAYHMSLIWKHKDWLKTLYNPPNDFPSLLNPNKKNLVIHCRVRNKIDAYPQPPNSEVTEEKAKKFIEKSGFKNNEYEIHIFSQSDCSESDRKHVSQLAIAINAKLHLDTDLVDTFDAMVRSDALLAAFGSNLSGIAGIIHKTGKVWKTTSHSQDWPLFKEFEKI